MTPRENKHAPSAAELKSRSDLDRARREISKLKRALELATKGAAAPPVAPAASDGAGAAPPADAAEVARLRAQLAELEDARRKLGVMVVRHAEQERSRAQRTHRVLEAVRGIGGELGRGALLQRLADAVRGVLGYRVVLVRTLEPGSDELRVAAAAGLADADRERLAREPLAAGEFRSWLREEFRVGRSYFIPHRSAFNRMLPAGVVADLGPRQEWEWHAEDVLLVPLARPDGELLGYLSVDDPADRLVPSQEAIELLEMFAAHAVVALDNARAVEALGRRGDELARANERLDGMITLRDGMVRALSHELRTPLAAIGATVETLLAAEPSGLAPERRRALLEAARVDGERLGRLVRSVLDLDRFEPGRPERRRERIDLAGLVAEASWLLRPLAEAGQVNLKVVNELADTTLEADRDPVRQMVLHLGGIAVNSAIAGSTVTLRVIGDQRTLTLRVEEPTPGDGSGEPGPGMVGGAGVEGPSTRDAVGDASGLAIARSIVETHGGRLAVTGEPGRGRVFAVRLARESARRVVTRHAEPSAVEELARSAVEMVSEAMDAGVVSVMGCEPGDELAILAAIGLEPGVVRDVRVPVGTGVAGWVARHRRPVCVRPDASPADGPVASRRDRYPGGSFLSVPLEGERGLLGVLNVTDDDDGRAFDDEDCALLLELARPIARVWERATGAETPRDADAAPGDTLDLVLRHLEQGRRALPHRVQLAQGLARELALPAELVRAVGFAATVHDVGMTLVGRDVTGHAGPLTAAQRAEMERHVELGVRMLGPLERMGAVRDIVRAHHEWWDGSGYPRGLSGAAIPVGARILAVVDAFESMTLGRAHRAPVTEMAALNELVRLGGTQFDPAVVEAFERMLPMLNAPETATAAGHETRGATNAGR